jgi:hypothetical protein
MFRGCLAIWTTMMIILAATYLTYGPLNPGPHYDYEAERRLASVATTHSTEYVLGTIVTLIAAYFVWRHPTTSASKGMD